MNTPQKLTGRKRFQQAFGKPIEEFESIKRAAECLGERTKKNYYRVLPDYFLFLKQNPDKVIAQRREDVFSDNPEDAERYEKKTKTYIRLLLKKEQAGRTINCTHLSRIQGFFSNNSKRYALDLRKKPRIPKARKIQKYSPTNEEIRHLYGIADSARDRLIIALMYQNGPAPVDVSLLNTGDLPQELWAYYEKSRSKTGEIWRGIITPDIAAELKAYLKIRGNPSALEPLFVGRQGPLDNQGVSEVVSNLIKKAGLNENNSFKPTSLRDAFEDALVEANVNHKIKEALMGHTSDIEHEYGGHNKLVVSCVEAMKKAYPLLSLNGAKRQEQSTNAEITELRAQVKKMTEEIKYIREFADRLVEIENDLFKDRQMFEELLGIDGLTDEQERLGIVPEKQGKGKKQ